MELTDKCGQCGRVVTIGKTKEEGLIVEVQLADGEVQHRIGVMENQEGATMRLERPPCLLDTCSRSVWFEDGKAGFR